MGHQCENTSVFRHSNRRRRVIVRIEWSEYAVRLTSSCAKAAFLSIPDTVSCANALVSLCFCESPPRHHLDTRPPRIVNQIVRKGGCSLRGPENAFFRRSFAADVRRRVFVDGHPPTIWFSWLSLLFAQSDRTHFLD